MRFAARLYSYDHVPDIDSSFPSLSLHHESNAADSSGAPLPAAQRKPSSYAHHVDQKLI
jgi:hypothetical protein